MVIQLRQHLGGCLKHLDRSPQENKIQVLNDENCLRFGAKTFEIIELFTGGIERGCADLRQEHCASALPSKNLCWLSKAPKANPPYGTAGEKTGGTSRSLPSALIPIHHVQPYGGENESTLISALCFMVNGQESVQLEVAAAVFVPSFVHQEWMPASEWLTRSWIRMNIVSATTSRCCKHLLQSAQAGTLISCAYLTTSHSYTKE